MKGPRSVAWIAAAAAVVFVLMGAGCGGVFHIGERYPYPAVNIAAENLKLAIAFSDNVPDTITMESGLSQMNITAIHKTMSNSLKNGFGHYVVDNIEDSNLVLEITSFSIRREQIANIGATIGLRYKAVLRLTKNGKVFRTAAGTAFPKNPLTSDWERIYDDGYETMFEQITNQLFDGGNFVLPEIPDNESEEEKKKAADKEV